MRIAVVADDAAWQEWISTGIAEGADVQQLAVPAIIPGISAYIDLLFDRQENRHEQWASVVNEPVIFNDTLKTHVELPGNFIRINAWPTFSGRPVAEVAESTEVWKERTEQVLAAFHKKAEWVPDIAGFISARVVCMMINEAWYALEEGVSTKAETDIAMKLGTNYPYGPFEWGNKIGLARVFGLLSKLAGQNSRYSPCAALAKETMAIK